MSIILENQLKSLEGKMAQGEMKVPGFLLQETPKIYVASIPGSWLLERTTPSWRIEDPEKGFQRVVKESRTRSIAMAVLDQQRTFPNAIVLATNLTNIQTIDCSLLFPNSIRFLVVDGQHRLWAQKYSNFNAEYACVIHFGLTEEEMAFLFLEINDNQKKVSPSLRWDLVRLVRPDDDPYGIASAEIIFQLASEKESPLFQRIDLTGEQSEILLKQASIAPEIRTLLAKKGQIHDLAFDEQYNLFLQYFFAIKDLDPDTWGKSDNVFYKARILRALLRLLPDLLDRTGDVVSKLSFQYFLPFLEKIDRNSITQEEIRAVQGSAGIIDIYKRIHQQVFS